MEKTKLVSLHAEEKKMLLEVRQEKCFFSYFLPCFESSFVMHVCLLYLFQDKQRLLSEVENLKSRLNIFEQDKRDIAEIVAQKNALLSNLENEISTYK